MCGIAGYFSFQHTNRSTIDQMVRALARRGPNGEGVWTDPAAGIALGHTRLSIIDLSSAGRQPMTHAEGRFWITFNGEIYNYMELRHELEAAGVVFVTHTDTEVILAGWNRWGSKLLERLRGMFAFALWDRHENRLVLARDRLGIKPLVWAEIAGGIVFASELRSLLASSLVAPVAAPQAVFDLLATGSVRQPGTALRGVQTLEPGTCMSVEGDGRRSAMRYWDAADAAAPLRRELAGQPYSENVRLVRQRLEEACRYHLVSDVPVGSFLSGGIDSTAVTALMAQAMPQKVKSFSVGFSNTGRVVHELDAARTAAEHIGCEHTEVVLTGQMVADSFDDLVRCMDQPSHDGTNTYFVSQAARRNVTVALSGLGGDELFAGYPHFVILQNATRRPPAATDRLLAILHRLRPNRFTHTSSIRCLAPAERFAELRRVLPDAAIAAAVAQPLRAAFNPGFLESAVQPQIDETQDILVQTALVECQQYLLNTLLHDADVMSMGHSMEVRPILLDHKLVELALALPATAKIRDGRTKAVLKDAVCDLLPPSLLTRPKSGFELPLGAWLKSDLRDRLHEALAAPLAKEFFQPQFLATCGAGLDEGNRTKLQWSVLMFLSWAREHGVHAG